MDVDVGGYTAVVGARICVFVYMSTRKGRV